MLSNITKIITHKNRLLFQANFMLSPSFWALFDVPRYDMSMYVIHKYIYIYSFIILYLYSFVYIYINPSTLLHCALERLCLMAKLFPVVSRPL